MGKEGANHEEVLNRLKRIEGQLRGIQKMIRDNRYCIDILTQLHSTVGAISSVEDKILKKHFDNCVVSAFRSSSKKEREEKIEEILDLIAKFRR